MFCFAALLDSVPFKDVFAIDATVGREILLFDGDEDVFDLMRALGFEFWQERLGGHSRFDNEPRAWFQRARQAGEKFFHVGVLKKAKAVSETVGTVVESFALNRAHVAEDEFN